MQVAIQDSETPLAAKPEMELIAKYGGPVPRYTSYPTALQFHAGVGAATVEGWLGSLRDAGEASVYLHMAYCKSLCLYCGCNMKVTNKPETITAYVDVLIDEMRRTAALLPERLKVGAIHLGGGTPSYVPMKDLRRVFAVLNELFDVTDSAEISMEIDPRQLAEGMPALLGELGFNRASLGIQDTNDVVQQVIRRVQPQEMNVRAVSQLRTAGVQDINVDLLYGLPMQTRATMRQTVADMMELKPSRIALFGYAHVPWMKKHQAVLENHELPDAEARLAIFNTAVEELTKAGYVAVGIDHFCLPTDPMAIAAKDGELKRNFMGYTTDAAPVLLGFGASAISQYRQGYAQNITAPAEYLDAMTRKGLPIARGVAVSEGDVARRGVIEQLLCGMRAEGRDLDDLLVQRERLEAMIGDGLAEWQGERLCVTEKGRPFARAVAACFDAYLGKGASTMGRHSKGV